MAFQLLEYLLPVLNIYLSHRQNCETGVSVIIWSRARRLWSGGTCLWCPHTRPQSGLSRHMSGTQISSEDRRKLTHHNLLKFFFFYFISFFNFLIQKISCRNLLITWLFFPSSLGTSRLRTETNLCWKWRQERTSIQFRLKCNCNILQTAKLETSKRHQLLHDGLEKLQPWLNFLLWIAGFCCSAHCGDVHPVCGHIVSIGHYRYEDVCMDKRGFLWIISQRWSTFHWQNDLFTDTNTRLLVELCLRDDDLTGVGLMRVFNWMV